MSEQEIIKKAKNLGINPNSNPNQTELQNIAMELGMNPNNYDIAEIVRQLESMNIEQLEPINKEIVDNTYNDNVSVYQTDINNHNHFGEKEYNQAKNEDEIYDKNYYKNRGHELDEKVKEAEENKNKQTKEVPDKETNDGMPTKTVNKTRTEQLKDRAELLKAKNERFQNKINGAKAKAYNVMHPGEALKDKAKSVTKNATKKVGDAAGKAIKKGANTGVKALVSLIKKNPYVLLAIGGIVLLLIILMLLFSAGTAYTENIETYCDTVDNNNFSMKSTPFEQIEFTDKVTSYFNQNDNYSSCNYYLADVDIVDTIYDTSLDNEISPEYTVIKAILNDCSPDIDYSYNNLWNLACESSYCQFETLEEGITYFANSNKYNTLEDTFYDIYDEEELNAAISEVVNFRDNIFYDGEYDFDCTSIIYNPSYQHYQKGEMYKQNDPLWANKYLGNSNSSMGGYGCAVTTIANGISAYATNLTVEYFDAGVFLDKLNAGGCFTDAGAIYWGCNTITQIAPSVEYATNISHILNSSNSTKIGYLNAYPADKYFLVVGINERHYVLFHGMLDADTFNSIDPSPGGELAHKISEISQIVVYKYN